MRGWQPIHTVGAILAAVGAGCLFGGWWLAVWSKGVFVSKAGAAGGPLFLVLGLSMLAFPRVWSGPDGNEISPRKWAVEGIFALGLLLGLADLLLLKALVGR